MKRYILLEIIPSSLFPNKGEVLQLSALKIDNFKILDKFDKRIIDEKLPFEKLKELISYDSENFDYEQDSKNIMQKFKQWAEDFPLLIIDNAYTKNYLNFYQIANKQTSVFDLLKMTYHDNIIDEILEKYNLQPSNYVVDLLFEALIYQENLNINLG